MIKKFESYQPDLYEQKDISLTRYQEIKHQRGTPIPFDEVQFLINKIQNSIN